jgi:hypothetical protein
MIIKKTNSSAAAVEESRVELVERHFGRYLEHAAYGITLEGNVEGGGGRAPRRIFML